MQPTEDVNNSQIMKFSGDACEQFFKFRLSTSTKIYLHIYMRYLRS